MSAQVKAMAPLRLHALSIGDLLDESISLYRRNWVQFVTIAAIVTIPITILDLGFTLLSTSASQPFDITGPSAYSRGPALLSLAGQMGQFIVALISIAVNGLMFGALVYAAGHSYLGQSVTTRRAFSFSWQRYGVMVGTFFLFLFIMLALLVVTIIPCVGWLGGPPALAFVTINLSQLIIPVIMLENKGGTASLRRSWALAKSQFWRVALVMGVLYLFNLALVGGPTWVIMFLAFTVVRNPALASVVTVAATSAAGLIVTPIWGVCMTLLYYDTRVRREAFDLELIAGTQATPADEQGPLIARSDWKTLGILTLLVVPVLALLFLIGPMLALPLLGLMQGL